MGHMAGTTGLEPATSRLTSECSTLLSYAPKGWLFRRQTSKTENRRCCDDPVALREMEIAQVAARRRPRTRSPRGSILAFVLTGDERTVDHGGIYMLSAQRPSRGSFRPKLAVSQHHYDRVPTALHA